MARCLFTLLALLLVPASAAAQPTRFRFPAEDPTGDLFMLVPVVHMDHDPKVDPTGTTCDNFAGKGLPWCYDGHKGTDYLLMWGFSTMDKHDVQVVAAAHGVVTRAEDGNYDRCHDIGGFKVSCDGYPMKANQVTVRHADGISSRYLHLKKGSVKVKVGQKVSCGQLLGYVGSSGKSARPHLHFQLEDAANKAIDPYAGKNSQPTSYWTKQDGKDGKPGTLCQGEDGKDAGPDGDSGGHSNAGDSGNGAGDGGAWRAHGGGCTISSPNRPGSFPLIPSILLLLLAFLRVR